VWCIAQAKNDSSILARSEQSLIAGIQAIKCRQDGVDGPLPDGSGPHTYAVCLHPVFAHTCSFRTIEQLVNIVSSGSHEQTCHLRTVCIYDISTHTRGMTSGGSDKPYSPGMFVRTTDWICRSASKVFVRISAARKKNRAATCAGKLCDSDIIHSRNEKGALPA
jgi:hypothetical protein